MPMKTSASRSCRVVTGCLAPRGARSQGSVTSTVSSVSTRWSRSASSSACLTASASRTSASATPTRLPASARAAGGSAPISRFASLSGDRSPACASRAAFSSSRFRVFAMAARASPSMRSSSPAESAVTSTGSYDLFGADIKCAPLAGRRAVCLSGPMLPSRRRRPLGLPHRIRGFPGWRGVPGGQIPAVHRATGSPVPSDSTGAAGRAGAAPSGRRGRHPCAAAPVGCAEWCSDGLSS